MDKPQLFLAVGKSHVHLLNCCSSRVGPAGSKLLSPYGGLENQEHQTTLGLAGSLLPILSEVDADRMSGRKSILCFSVGHASFGSTSSPWLEFGMEPRCGLPWAVLLLFIRGYCRPQRSLVPFGVGNIAPLLTTPTQDHLHFTAFEPVLSTGAIRDNL